MKLRRHRWKQSLLVSFMNTNRVTGISVRSDKAPKVPLYATRQSGNCRLMSQAMEISSRSYGMQSL
uniref:Uncharacterized protein n=1 Tax=Salmonella sp. TaxID=599 RepID=A0A482EUA3_SALSP|nr:hypothetical protein NNIBIDOC_00074 [Salmonella sp.]